MGIRAGRLNYLSVVGALGLILVLGIFNIQVPGYAQSDIVAILDSPQTGERVQGDVDLVGTVRGTGLQRYELHYRPVGEGQEFIYFEGDQIQVEGGVLGRWSTGGLAPGEYEIRLQAVSDNQQIVETTVTITLIPEGSNEQAQTESESTVPAASPSLPEDTTLRQALDQLALRARPVALWAYMQRGMRWSGVVVLVVLAYFGLKSLVLFLARRVTRQ